MVATKMKPPSKNFISLQNTEFKSLVPYHAEIGLIVPLNISCYRPISMKKEIYMLQ